MESSTIANDSEPLVFADHPVAIAQERPSAQPLTTEEIQALLDRASGRTYEIRWPRHEPVVIPPGRYVITKTLVISSGELTAGDGTYYATRGKLPRIIAWGAIFEADPTVNWEGRSLLEIDGGAVSMHGLSIQVAENIKHPPAAGILGGVIDVPTAPLRHQFSGGPSNFDGVEIIGPFTRAPFAAVNLEMVNFYGCDFVTTARNGSALLLAKGHDGIIRSSRISTKPHTQTNVNMFGGRLASKDGPLVETLGYVGQVMIMGPIMQTEGGEVWKAAPVPGDVNRVIAVRFIGGRWETHSASHLARFLPGITPERCEIDGVSFTRHGKNPEYFDLWVGDQAFSEDQIRGSQLNWSWTNIRENRKAG